MKNKFHRQLKAKGAARARRSWCGRFVDEFRREEDETRVEEGDSEVEGDLNDDEFAE